MGIMTYRVIRRTADNAVVLFGETLNRDPIAALGEEERVYDGAIPDNLTRGAIIANDGTVTPLVVPTVDRTEEIRAAAKLHAEAVEPLINPQWFFTAIGSRRGALANERYRNVWFWALSPLLVINAILDSSAADWTTARAETALEAYKILVPADQTKITTWYTAHDSRGYWNTRAVVSTPYFYWSPGIPALFPFASDASASTAWDGTGGTLAVTIPVGAASVAEALADAA